MATISVTTNDNTYSLTVRPEYSLYFNRWKLQAEAYEGSGGFIDGGWLVQHARESTTGYNARKAICWFPNYPRSLFDTLKGYLYKEPVTRSTDNKQIETFFEKTDKAGRITIDELMRKADRLSDIYGYSFILIDKPSGEFVSLADELSNGLPYAYILKPEQVINWQKDDNEEFIWVKIKEIVVNDKYNPSGDHKDVLQVRVWTRNETWLENAKGEMIGGLVEHGLGRVPIVQIKSQESIIYPDIGTTIFSTIAQIALSLFNKISQKDSLLGNQTFAIFYYPSDTALGQPAASGDTSATKNMVTLTDNSMMNIPLGTTMAPGFASPDGSAVEAYDRSIEMMIRMMGELVNLKFVGGIYSSGLEAKLDFEKTNQSLIATAEKLSDAEKSVIDLYRLWLGIEGDDTVIKYPTDFNLRDLEQRLKEIFDTLTIGISDTFNREYKKQASRELLPEASAEIQAIIDEEIDSELPDIEGVIDYGETDREPSDSESV